MQSEWDIKNCPHRFEFMKRGTSAMIPTKFIFLYQAQYIRKSYYFPRNTYNVVHIVQNKSGIWFNI